MRLKTLSLLIIISAALTACQKNHTDPVARGEVYFKAYGCVSCHQIGSTGNAYGPDLTFVGFRKSPEWLDLWLKNPHAWRKQTVMPNFNLNEEIRGSIVAYLAAQKGQAWDQAGRPWNHPEITDEVKRGEILFDKAGCVACHAQGGKGGYPNNNVVGGQIPSLTKVFEGYTKEELEAKIRNGVVSAPADPSAPAPMIFMPKWGEVLKDAEIDAVASYLLSLGNKAGVKKDDW